MLDLHNLHQHIQKPTHISNHTLDMIISRKDSSLVSSPMVVNTLPSDHFAVRCYVDIIRPGPSTKCVKSCQTRKIDNQQFQCDISSALEFDSSNTASLDDLVIKYNTKLSNTLEKHAR